MEKRQSTSMVKYGATASLLIFLSVSLVWGLARHIDKDQTSNPKYSWAMGKKYQTKQDFILFLIEKNSKIPHVDTFGGMVPERHEIKSDFPYKDKIYGNIILGILPIQSEFKVIDIRETGSTNATFIHYFGEITKCTNPEWIGKEINITYLTNMSFNSDFEKDLVEEIK